MRIKTACQSDGVFGTTGFILLATSRYPVEMSCVMNGTVAPHGHSRRARNWTVLFEDMASAKWPSHTGPRCDRNMFAEGAYHPITACPFDRQASRWMRSLFASFHSHTCGPSFVPYRGVRAPCSRVPGGTEADILVSICRLSNVSLSVTELSESEYCWKKGILGHC